MKGATTNTVLICGRKWKVRWRRMKDCLGLCDTARKTITLHPDIERHGELGVFGTAIHEAVHAALSELEEFIVTEIESAAVKVSRCAAKRINAK